MPDRTFDQYRFATRAVRAGQHRTAEGEHAEPLFLTSSFVFDDAAAAEARFSGAAPGNVYSRFTNPTVRTFEERLAALEGGACCVATASGMSAILATCMGLLQAGDHILASRSIFGSTVILFDRYLRRFGIETTYVPLTDVDAWREALRPQTKLLYLETPSNPLNEIADIGALGALAHDHGAVLVVDNVYATPALQRPLELGADLVVHSATKYIDGQGRCLGGAVVGDAQRVGGDVYGFLRTAGPTMSPFNAWVFLKGLETLSLRMERHCANAREIVRWLDGQPQVAHVYHPSLLHHAQHDLARRQQADYGAVMAFDLHGGKAAAWRFIDALSLLSVTANLGDTKTTVTHPATTTHGRLTPEQRAEIGIGDGLVRISVGLEDVADIQADLEQGLAALKG